MANNDNLKDLISVQQQLLENTDEINKQVRAAGLLGSQYKEARKVMESINSTIRESISIRSDENKSFFTTLQVRRNINKLVQEQKRVEETLVSVQGRLSMQDKAKIADYTNQLKIIKDTVSEQDRLQDILNTHNLTQKQEIAIRQSLLGYADKEYEAYQKADELLKDRKVAEVALLQNSYEAIKSAKELNQQYVDSISWMEKMILGAGELSKKLGKNDLFKGVLGGLGIAGTTAGIFKSLVESAFSVDNSITNIAKNSGVTKDLSKDIANSYTETVHNMTVMNSNLDKSLLTITGMLKAQQELQASSGQLALFSAKRAQDQLYLTKQLGLEADEAAKLQQLSMLTSQSTSAVTDDVYEQVAASNKENGLRTSGLEVLKSVAKIEGALSANYKNNPKLIAAAAAQAKALGISLEQAAQASNSLLDFESSIANELEAELLTGKKWNLEKARSLALDGDAAGAAKEMLRNVGSYSDFLTQNVIARQAEAKAVGMTADELSNAMRTQELMKGFSKETLEAINQSGDKAKYMAQLNSATNATEMQAAQARVSEQMKFEESMARVREAVGIMASGPLLKMVEFVRSMTEESWKLKTVLVSVAATMAAIAASSITTAISMALVTGGASALSGAAVIGSILGAAALGGGIMAATVNDSLISPSGGILISTPEGMIKPNKNDHIITTTDPKSVLGGGGGGNSERLLSAILEAVKQPGKVYMGATEVGTTLGISYSAYA